MNQSFLFSYSSLNKLLFAPKLFFNHYFLNQKEEKIESYLVDGKLVHCYVLQPEAFDDLFCIAPSKTPTDSVRKVLHAVHDRVDGGPLGDHHSTILEVLQEENLYQSFKEEAKRLERILTEDNEFYYSFIGNKDKTVVDEVTIARCQEQADTMLNYDPIKQHILESRDSRYIVFNEVPLMIENYVGEFGLKGIIDRYVIDTQTNTVRIIDVKTSGKTVGTFVTDSLEYYNYWLQAAIYIRLIQKHHNIPVENISYSFWVIDKYQQVYEFHLSNQTKLEYLSKLEEVLDQARYHFNTMDFSLPYSLLQPLSNII